MLKRRERPEGRKVQNMPDFHSADRALCHLLVTLSLVFFLPCEVKSRLLSVAGVYLAPLPNCHSLFLSCRLLFIHLVPSLWFLLSKPLSPSSVPVSAVLLFFSFLLFKGPLLFCFFLHQTCCQKLFTAHMIKSGSGSNDIKGRDRFKKLHFKP